MIRKISIIPFLFLVMIFQSCKKQYSCLCSITLEQPGYYPFVTSTVKAINEKTTKRRAKSICDQTQKQLYNYTSNDYATPSEKLTVECAVKE